MTSIDRCAPATLGESTAPFLPRLCEHRCGSAAEVAQNVSANERHEKRVAFAEVPRSACRGQTANFDWNPRSSVRHRTGAWKLTSMPSEPTEGPEALRQTRHDDRLARIRVSLDTSDEGERRAA